MEDNNSASLENKKEIEEVDIVWLLRYLFAQRKTVLLTTCVTIIICIIVYVCKPNVYTCTTSILPISEKSSMSGNMGLLASMTGLNVSGSTSQNLITSDLYPAVASSTPFLKKMMHIPVKWSDKDSLMTTYEYAMNSKPSLGDYLKQYTIGLPNTIASWFSSPQNIVSESHLSEMIESDTEPQFLSLSIAELKAKAILSSMISIEQDSKFSSINVSATCETPEQATTLATSALEILQEIITQYKTKQASVTLKYLEERYEDVQDEYSDIRSKYLNYKDSHRNMIDERVDIEYQRLTDQYQIAYTITKTLASQIEEAKLDLMKKTPSFSILEPAVVPITKSGPNISKYLLIGLALGIILPIGGYILYVGFIQVFEEEKYKALKAKYDVQSK
ncbi:MAG: hypothetical protein HUJ96_00825 [Marinilabiliaceae bacterium]|nr:hypothetical protein [Marinilabiliaceae bacterium]